MGTSATTATTKHEQQRRRTTSNSDDGDDERQTEEAGLAGRWVQGDGEMGGMARGGGYCTTAIPVRPVLLELQPGVAGWYCLTRTGARAGSWGVTCGGPSEVESEV